MSNFKRHPNERSGQLPVLSEMQYGKGKVVFMGAAYSFSNAIIYRFNTWKLGLNAVNWLSNQPVTTNYQPVVFFLI